MGSPGPRAFGSDVIETARCGASPRDQTRSSRSLWQEQVLWTIRHDRLIAVTPTFHVETGTFDRDGRLAVSAPVFGVGLMEGDAE
jgi:hypothetical protein